MEYKKFESDFLEVTLHAIILDGSRAKDLFKALKKIEKVLGRGVIGKDELSDSRGYCMSNRHDQEVIVINTDKKLHKLGPWSIVNTLQHECSHFMWHELQCISSTPTYHNEFEMRLSDWAFMKITSMKYFQGL